MFRWLVFALSLMAAAPVAAQNWPAKPVMDKFHAELLKALKLPEVNKTLTETLGMDVQASTPEALQKFLVGEIARWGKVVKDNNIRAD